MGRRWKKFKRKVLPHVLAGLIGTSIGVGSSIAIGKISEKINRVIAKRNASTTGKTEVTALKYKQAIKGNKLQKKNILRFQERELIKGSGFNPGYVKELKDLMPKYWEEYKALFFKKGGGEKGSFEAKKKFIMQKGYDIPLALNVDPALIFSLIEHESGFNRFAKGKAGELGLGQIKGITEKDAQRINEIFGGKVFDKSMTGWLYQPFYNIFLTTVHLKNMYYSRVVQSLPEEYRLSAALKAYNLGLGNFTKQLIRRKIIRIEENGKVYITKNKKILKKYWKEIAKKNGKTYDELVLLHYDSIRRNHKNKK